MGGRELRSRKRHSGWGDGAAVAISLLCLLHCVALPLIVAALPTLAAALPTPEWVHEGLLALAIPLSVKVLLMGSRRHGNRLPTIIGGVGLAAMTGGIVFDEASLLETGLTVTGTTLVAIAHLRNWRLLAIPRSTQDGAQVQRA